MTTPYKLKLDVDDDGVYNGVPSQMQEKNKNKRRCKVCKKTLSMYNLTKYCYLHQLDGQKIEDNEYDRKKHYQLKTKNQHQSNKYKQEGRGNVKNEPNN